ncbi:MAG: hypothetical protein ACI4RA_09555 [Kiritimatiellia bacterium]
MGNQWWLRTPDEVFGPVTRESLLEWARMGRIQPGQDVSEDGETWMPATDVPFLDMRWSIDIGDGTPRGPFNKQAAQALLASGRLPQGSRLVEIMPPSSDMPGPDEPFDDAPVAETPAPVEAPADSAPASAELEDLRRQLETLQTGLRAAEARAAEAERRVAEAQREAKAAVKAADVAEARLAAVQSAAAQREADITAAARAEKDNAVAEKESALKAKDAALEAAKQEVTEAKSMAKAAESDLAELVSTTQANEAAYEVRIKSLSDEIKRLPSTAQLAADAQAAVYALMREEADELAAALEAEDKEAEALRRYRRQRTERLLARRQEILRRIGTDAEDMTRRALKAHPEDPRTVRMRQELDALRILQERSALESERKIRDLSAKLRDSMGEAKRLREQAADATVIYRQLQDAREKLMTREKELMEERQKAEAERQQHAAAQQALLTRLSSLELGMPGATHQSREAHTVRLAPWMGLRQ